MLSGTSFCVDISSAGAWLPGDLDVPDRPKGIVVYAHGSGSSRGSPRNRYVAERLQAAGFATLLFDLLTPEEDQIHAMRFDIDLLARRLSGTLRWLDIQTDLASLPVGLFGASTGAAAALLAAAELPARVSAIVSCGGRPDLAVRCLRQVSSPTLFIVGSMDPDVLNLNRLAIQAMASNVPRKLEIVDGATHLFEEPGALDQVAELAKGWFETYAARD